MSEAARIVQHLSVDEIRMKMKMKGGFLQFQKWLVIYNALVDPRPVSEIARHTGLCEASVSRIIADYNQNGPKTLDAAGGIGRSSWFAGAGAHTA